MTERFFIHPDSWIPADFPMSKIFDLLRSIGYRWDTAEYICDYAYRFGTVEECDALISDDDRRLVEDLLPMAPETTWEHAEGVAF